MKPNAVLFFALSLLALAPACVSAQDRYPSKPIQMLVAYSTGTTTDILARTFAEKLGPRLGHTVTVQNRPGAGGTLAGQAVASAAPDGYTILSVNSSHAIDPSLYTRLPYDIVRVGFEDNIYLPDGRPARHNHELVAATARIARDFGREPATTDEAREIFGIRR